MKLILRLALPALLGLAAGSAAAQTTVLNPLPKATPAKGSTKAAKAAKGKKKPAPEPAPTLLAAPTEPASVAMPMTSLEVATDAAGSTSEWLLDLSAARAQAKVSGRPIVAVFSGSDWCKPCVIFEKEVFSQPEFMSYAKEHLVLAHFDFPRQKKNLLPPAQTKLNEQAAAELNRAGDFPLAVVVSPEGKVLGRSGYVGGGPQAFIAYLKTLPGLGQ